MIIELVVKPVGKIVVELNSIELKRFRIVAPDGKKRIKFDYEIVQTHANQQGTMQFKATSNGKEIGKADVRFWRQDLRGYSLL